MKCLYNTTVTCWKLTKRIKTPVKSLSFPLFNTETQLKFSGGHPWAAQQNSSLERRHSVIRPQLSRPSDSSQRQKLSSHSRFGSWLRHHAIRTSCRRCIHHGLSLSHVRVTSFRCSAFQFRQQASVRIKKTIGKRLLNAFFRTSHFVNLPGKRSMKVHLLDQ